MKEKILDNGSILYSVDYEEKEITISYIESDQETFIIPDKIDDFPVVILGKEPYPSLLAKGYMSKNSKIKKLYFGKNINYIFENFFRDCESLEEIYFNKKIYDIGQKSFSGCKNIKKLVFPKNCNLNYVGSSCFEDCFYLEEVNLPKKIKYIEDTAFNNCPSLVSIDLPEEITSLEPLVLAYTNQLTFLKIPRSVTYISETSAYKSGLKKLQLTSPHVQIHPLFCSGKTDIEIEIDHNDVNAFLEHHSDNIKFVENTQAIFTSSGYPITSFPDTEVL